MLILRNLEALIGASSVKAVQKHPFNDETECTCGLFLDGLYREDLASQIVAALICEEPTVDFHSWLFFYGEGKRIQGNTVVDWLSHCPHCLGFLVRLADLADKTYTDLGDEV